MFHELLLMTGQWRCFTEHTGLSSTVVHCEEDMSDVQITPWRAVNETIVASWSSLELIYNMQHELLSSATRVFGKGYALLQGGYGFANATQKEILERLAPHIDHIMDAAYRVTLWTDMQREVHTEMVRAINNQQEVARWSSVDLLKNVHHELKDNIQMILGLTRDLSNDTYGIVDPNQQTIFASFQRDVYKIQKITGFIWLWLDKNVNTV
jgi:hypothetical protein